ncbi:zinc metallopeptidase [Membranihabitans maritimus]|uniref:zinc metallopeptidase n=1 Tax=Membranihabitans maritimus TaxID=2904244 RepID=UPI001F1661CF|nr:zinc metallopeptidase [Membranihabitans maritimus]
MGGYTGYIIIAVAFSIIGWFVSNRLKSKFRIYSKDQISSGQSGKEIAEQMLSYYGINDVQVLPAKGFLSDHYNPANRTVNLSPEVYQGRSVMSAAVAAHECGHAVQHATSYNMLKFRSAIVPVVKVASGLQQYLLLFALGGFGMNMNGAGGTILIITILAFGVTTLFSLVTLPVEFDASRRALVWLDQNNVTAGKEHEKARDALKWAAMTYVAAALSSLVMLLYLVMQLMGSRD